MIRAWNRKIHNYLRPKRLTLGRYFWDVKKNNKKIVSENIIENEKISSILFFRPEGKIGDMIITTFLFREIKKRYSNIKIGVVSRDGATEVIKNNKNIDVIYNYSKKRSDIKKLTYEISKEKYDLLIDFSKILKVNNMMFINLCKAKFNMGINKEDWNLFNISLKKADYNSHISKLYNDILEKLGIYNADLSYDIYLTEENNKKVKSIKEKYIVFNPYAASKHRSFNREKSLEISKTILENRKENLVLIGTKDHKKELEEIKNKLGERVTIPNAVGILDVASIIKKSNLVITPDTSIVHIGVAFNKELIGIYRKGIPDKNSIFWGPNSKKAKILFVEEKVEKYEEIDINKLDINRLKNILKE